MGVGSDSDLMADAGSVYGSAVGSGSGSVSMAGVVRDWIDSEYCMWLTYG